MRIVPLLLFVLFAGLLHAQVRVYSRHETDPDSAAAYRSQAEAPRKPLASAPPPPSDQPYRAAPKPPDTTITLSIHGTDTTRIITVRRENSLAEMNRSLKTIAAVQIASLVISIGSVIVMLVAFN